MKVLFVRHAQSLNNAVQGQVQTKLASGCTDVHGAQVCRLLSFCRERGPLSQDPSLSRPPFPERMAVHAARGPATVRCREVRPASSATHVACAPASGVKARQLNPLLFSQGTAPFALGKGGERGRDLEKAGRAHGRKTRVDRPAPRVHRYSRLRASSAPVPALRCSGSVRGARRAPSSVPRPRVRRHEHARRGVKLGFHRVQEWRFRYRTLLERS